MSFAEIDPKSIDLSVVKLMFIAYIQDNYGNVRMLQPVCSKPIAHKSELFYFSYFEIKTLKAVIIQAFRFSFALKVT